MEILAGNDDAIETSPQLLLTDQCATVMYQELYDF